MTRALCLLWAALAALTSSFQLPSAPAGRWPATYDTKRLTTVYLVDGMDFAMSQTHVNAGGWVCVANSPGHKPRRISVRDSIFSFQPDRPGEELAGKAANWGGRFYGIYDVDPSNPDDWDLELVHWEARNIPREHALYIGKDGGRVLLQNCWVHDIGSQGFQDRSEAQSQWSGDLGNRPGLVRIDKCYFFDCGQSYGTRTSHTIKLFSFEKMDGTRVPSRTDLEIIDTVVKNVGKTSWAYGGKTYNSMGGIFCQEGDRFTMSGGGVDLKNPQYQLVQVMGRRRVSITGAYFAGDKVELQACGDNPATPEDEGDVVVQGCTGPATLQVKDHNPDPQKRKVIYQGPISAGYVQP